MICDNTWYVTDSYLISSVFNGLPSPLKYSYLCKYIGVYGNGVEINIDLAGRINCHNHFIFTLLFSGLCQRNLRFN